MDDDRARSLAAAQQNVSALLTPADADSLAEQIDNVVKQAADELPAEKSEGQLVLERLLAVSAHMSIVGGQLDSLKHAIGLPVAGCGGAPAGGREVSQFLPALRLLADRMEEQLTRDVLDQHFPEPVEPSPVVRLIDDLPQRAREDAARAGIASLIEGEPLRVGEMLEAAAKTDPRIAESFEAFHGSPHNFDRFSMDQVGAGQGAQSYGHGLYFAENEKVARSYQRSVSDKVFVDKVAQLYDEGFSPSDAWGEIKDNWSGFSAGEQRLMLALEKDDWLGFDYPHQAVRAALSDPHGKKWEMSPETAAAAQAMGNMYRVSIKANPEHFLDWDRPISQQSEHVQAALHRALGEKYFKNVQDVLPEVVLRGAADKAADASARLRDAGIPGVKYLDQGSRIHDLRLSHELPRWREAVSKAEQALEIARAQQASKREIAEREAEVVRAKDGLARTEGHLAETTRNYVLFDDKHIEITHKNGDPVNAPAPAGNPKIVLGSDAQRAAGDTTASRADAQPPPTDKIILGADLQGASPALDEGRQDAAIKALGAAAGRLHKAEPGSNKARAAVEGVRAAEKKLRKEFGILSTEQIEAMGPDHPRARVEAERAGMVGEIENILGRDLPLAERGAVSGVDPTGTTPADPAALRARVRELVQQLRNGEGANAGRDTADLAQLGRGEQPDAGPAPRDGGADPRAGGAPGLPDDGTGRGAGTAARDDGGDPGPAGAGRLDRDAAWRDLAQARPEFDDPDVLQASRTAAAVPTPPTRLDERVAAAEKAQAFAKQMYDMFAERLPDQDRQRLDDVIKAIDDDHEARETAIVRGGGCLFGVV